jgi:lysyl-tRNA synthetase class II
MSSRNVLRRPKKPRRLLRKPPVRQSSQLRKPRTMLYVRQLCPCDDCLTLVQDYASDFYGKLPLHQSQKRDGRTRAQIGSLSASDDGSEVYLRARVHTSRAQGNKMVFFALRQQSHTVQALLSVSPEKVSKQMAKWAATLGMESIVVVQGIVKKTPEPIKSCSVSDVEIHISQV